MSPTVTSWTPGRLLSAGDWSTVRPRVRQRTPHLESGQQIYETSADPTWYINVKNLRTS